MRLPVQVATATVALGDYFKNRAIVAAKVDGITFTLPKSRGTGNKYYIVVGSALTSSSIVVSAGSGDKFQGGAFINDTGDSSALTADFHPATAGSSNTLTLAQSVGAGKSGDYVEFEDVKTGTWQVTGVLTDENDPTNPFSAV